MTTTTPWTCAKCAHQLTSAYCPECGAARPAEPLPGQMVEELEAHLKAEHSIPPTEPKMVRLQDWLANDGLAFPIDRRGLINVSRLDAIDYAREQTAAAWSKLATEEQIAETRRLDRARLASKCDAIEAELTAARLERDEKMATDSGEWLREYQAACARERALVAENEKLAGAVRGNAQAARDLARLRELDKKYGNAETTEDEDEERNALLAGRPNEQGAKGSG